MKLETKKKILKAFWFCFWAGFALVAFSLLLVAVFGNIPSFKQLEDPDSNLATLLISEDGKVINTYHIENRSYVKYEELPEALVQAAVATEDVRFYRHAGIDFRGLARVGVKTLLLHRSEQGGGSTITQQLAKTLFKRPDTSSKIVMVKTKLKEWITAVKLERNYTKNEIITMYFNEIFFGSNAYGIKAAAATFFGKEPMDLSIEECACLVGMVNKPTKYNPALNYDNSMGRRNRVLEQMKKSKYITRHEYDSLCALPIVLNYKVQDHNSGLASYYRDMLRKVMNAEKPKRSSYQQVEDYRADSASWRNDPLYGWLKKNRRPDGSEYNLDRDGLRIYTTIDSRMQRYAEEAVAEHLGGTLQPALFNDLKYKRNRPFSNDVPQDIIDIVMKQAVRWSDRYRALKDAGANEAEIQASFERKTNMRVFSWNRKGYIDTLMTPNDSIKYYKSFLRTAFIAIEPGNGHVKAYVGGPDYRYFKYDSGRQGKRQVGSTIKPFLYTLAMQEGMTPCDKVICRPYTFVLADSTEWTPRSTDKDEYIGRTVTLKWGLTHSSNNISAYLMSQFGPEAMSDMCHRMGIHSHLDPVYSLCVGSCDLSVMEMVAAFNTFPSRGVFVEPQIVTRIEDSNGNVLADFVTRKREAISENTAYLMVNLMQGVVNEGTAGRLRRIYQLDGELAGKTGTTNDNSDGWFIGYVPKLTAGVWVGCEDRQVRFDSMTFGQGASMALPVWGIFMRKVYDDPTISIGSYDVFPRPVDSSLDLRCTGSSDDMISSGNSSSDGYFD